MPIKKLKDKGKEKATINEPL